MLFGTRKPAGLFGGQRQRQPWDTPGYGDGTQMGGDVQETAPMGGMMGDAPMPQAKKPGPNWAGIASDFLAGMNGQQGQYLASLQAEQQRAEAERQYQRRRMDENTDWQSRQQWGLANKPKPRNDTVDDFNWYKSLSEPDRVIYDQMRPVYKMGPDGLPYPMARGQVPGPTPDFTDDDWNAGQPVGGGNPPASRPLGGSGFVPPLRLKSGTMTSGRRTVEGNAAVGGVPGSDHLTGDAADYWGTDLNAVLGEVRGLPGHRKSFIHGKGGKRHVHGVGDWNAPYHGKNGTKGLKR